MVKNNREYKEMKKIFVFGLISILTLPAAATTMCAADDVLSIVLDPMIGGTSHNYNTDLFEWSTTFSYGTVWGIATCVDVKGSSNTAVDQLVDSNGEVATGGERTGVHCWCQMTHPLQSRWVFLYSYSSVGDCGSSCANGCGYYVRDVSGFRAGVFGSVGN